MKTLPGTCLLFILLCCACHHKAPSLTPYEAEHITKIETGNTTPDELVNYACSLAGTPYKYGSTDPEQGFDCSGFVTCVFNHFGIMVPRTSVDFTPVEHTVPLKDARLGNLILFTGTDSTNRIVLATWASSPPHPANLCGSCIPHQAKALVW